MSYSQTLTIYTATETDLLKRRAILVVAGGLLLSLAANLTFYLMPAKATIAPSANEQALIGLTNQQRLANGLGELHYDPKLSAAARAKANDMLQKGYFDHFSPDGQKPWDFIRNQNYSYIKAGENLAIDYPSVTAPVAAWMASPTHRANILKADYEDIGLAEVVGEYNGQETRIVVQMFGTKQFSLRPIVKLVGM